MKVDGADQVRGLNTVGLRRAGFADEDIEALEGRRAASSVRPQEDASPQSLAEFDMMNGINPHVKKMVEFLRRRDLGKHGRYLESLRTSYAAISFLIRIVIKTRRCHPAYSEGSGRGVGHADPWEYLRMTSSLRQAHVSIPNRITSSF